MYARAENLLCGALLAAGAGVARRRMHDQGQTSVAYGMTRPDTSLTRLRLARERDASRGIRSGRPTSAFAEGEGAACPINKKTLIFHYPPLADARLRAKSGSALTYPAFRHSRPHPI